ncbi:kinetochore protein Spc24-like [Mytilus trossulus]|uniref:kinetochore protein Spc24-like n=1 Tax=Mytilus trossulus TaxID=6551 RepID=UPI0030042F2D
MDDSLNEPEHIVRLAEELITVIDNEKIENTLLDDIVKEWQKILEIREIQKAQTKEVFQEVMQIESAEEANYHKSQTACQHLNQEGQSLEQLVSQHKEGLANVVSTCERLQQNLEACQQESQKLELEKQEVEKQKKISIPKTRHDITLYKLITNLHWQLDTPPNELKGYVCGNSEVKPFTFNKEQVSKYDIVNSLWDMIEEDW